MINLNLGLNFNISLRYRVAFAFLILGWLISIAMGTVLYKLTLNMEEQLLEETLSSELDDYIRRYTLNENTHPPSGIHIQGYVINGDMPDELPMQLRQAPLGLTHIKLHGQGYYVEVKEQHTMRFFVLYADTLIRQREQQYLWFLTIGMMLMTLLSSILGLWLAGKVIFPVTQLAQQVSTMRPDFSPLPSKEHMRDDEVGQLATAIDDYHQRLHAFNERERAFTSDVSHELRTPLAVIEGATEVMLAQPALDTTQQRIMQRIARASKQVTHLSTALLALAREDLDQADQTPCSVNQLLNDVVEDHRYLLIHKPVVVELTTATNEVMIACKPILLHVLLANIIRNAFSYTQQGTVNIALTAETVIISDTGTGMKDDQLSQIFQRHYSTERNNRTHKGHGIGLSLAWRIAQRYGWQISAQSKEGHSTSITLLLQNGR